MTTRERTIKKGRLSESVLDPAVEDHQAILDAIRMRDAVQAEKLMQAHMDYAYENLKRLCQEKAPEELQTKT